MVHPLHNTPLFGMHMPWTKLCSLVHKDDRYYWVLCVFFEFTCAMHFRHLHRGSTSTVARCQGVVKGTLVTTAKEQCTLAADYGRLKKHQPMLP